jgi:hypothetical protein
MFSYKNNRENKKPFTHLANPRRLQMAWKENGEEKKKKPGGSEFL